MTITAVFESIEEIQAFAGLFSGQASAPAKTAAPTQAAPTQAAVPAVTAPVVQAPAVTASQAPTAPAGAAVPLAAGTVPTSTAQYKLDDIARAAMSLMDSGRQAELQGLLAQFGVDALPLLPQAQYGAFATALRGMGAQI